MRRGSCWVFHVAASAVTGHQTCCGRDSALQQVDPNLPVHLCLCRVQSLSTTHRWETFTRHMEKQNHTSVFDGSSISFWTQFNLSDSDAVNWVCGIPQWVHIWGYSRCASIYSLYSPCNWFVLNDISKRAAHIFMDGRSPTTHDLHHKVVSAFQHSKEHWASDTRSTSLCWMFSAPSKGHKSKQYH